MSEMQSLAAQRGSDWLTVTSQECRLNFSQPGSRFLVELGASRGPFLNLLTLPAPPASTCVRPGISSGTGHAGSLHRWRTEAAGYTLPRALRVDSPEEIPVESSVSPPVLVASSVPRPRPGSPASLFPVFRPPPPLLGSCSR